MDIVTDETGKEREVVKVKSDNPSHAGYYTTYRDMMKPGDVEYSEPQTGGRPDDSRPGKQIDPVDPPADEPSKIKRGKR